MNKKLKNGNLIFLLVRLVILFINPIVCYSQIVISNVKLIDSTKRILYVGIDNEIVINGIDSTYEIAFKKSLCTLNKSNQTENRFYVRASKRGRDTLQIKRKNKKIFETEYLIEYIQEPICHFPNVQKGKATKRDIISKPFLYCYIPNNFLKIKFIISSFKVCTIHLNDTLALYDNEKFYRPDTIEVTDPITSEIKLIIKMKKSTNKINYGNKLTDFQIKSLEEINIGDKLFISDIEVLCPDGMNRRMKDILIEIN